MMNPQTRKMSEDSSSGRDEFLQNSDELDKEHENLVTLTSLPKCKSKEKTRKGAKHDLPFTFQP